MIEKKIRVTTFRKQAEEDRAYMRSLTPEQRLDLVEELRIQWCKMMNIEYPTRMVKVVRITKCHERLKDAKRIEDEAT